MAINKGFGRQQDKSKPMNFWQRANHAYYLVYGFMPPELWTKEDGIEGCEYAVISLLARLYQEKNIHPLAKKYKNSSELLAWFNKKYPPCTCLDQAAN